MKQKGTHPQKAQLPKDRKVNPLFQQQINEIATGISSATVPGRETFFKMVFLTDVDIIKICGTKTTMMYIHNTSPGSKPDYWMTNTLMLNAGENMP